jgi:uroporphyrinogen decarboxylase
MTSRERVLTALAHKEPDRVPVDLGGTTVTGISAIAYHYLKKYLGITTGHTRLYDVLQQLALVEDSIVEKFELDVLDVGVAFNREAADWYDVDLRGIPVQFPKWFHPRENPDGSYDIQHRDGTLLSTMIKDAFYFQQSYYPYYTRYPADFSNLLDAIQHQAAFYCAPPPYDNMDQKRFWRVLKQKAIELQRSSKKILTIQSGVSGFEAITSLRRMDKFLMDLIRAPAKIEKLLDKMQEFSKASLYFICHYLGDTIDIIRIGDDLGSNLGPFINPKLYRDIFKPRLAEICDYIKKHSSMKIFFHSCGSIQPFIPDFIELGIDILNPVQTNVKNMDPQQLKREYGDEITFWGGGADTREVLNRKSPADVEQHVLERLRIFAPGGGYIWSAIHNILPDVPPENIVAAFRAIKKYNEML